MPTSKLMLFLLAILCVSCQSNTNQQASQSDNAADAQESEVQLTKPNYAGQTLCFYGTSQDVLKHNLELSFEGNIVSGFMVIEQPQYGSPTGTIKGKLVDHTIIADWTLVIEDDKQVSQVVFKLDGDQLYEASGEKITREGKDVFKDMKKLKYEILYNKVDCSEISEVIGWVKEM